MPVEVSSAIVEWLANGQRREVTLEQAAAVLADDPWALRILSGIETRDGNVLTEQEVDRRLVTAQVELSRILREVRHAQQVSTVLNEAIGVLRDEGLEGPVRIVDIGCGIGWTTRWLAARSPHEEVQKAELVGVDLNGTFIKVAMNLADDEHLMCRFRHGDAMQWSDSAHIAISTGMLHQFNAQRMQEFFAFQRKSGFSIVCHWDAIPSKRSRIGSALFHFARMSEPIARHDGIVAARTAHPDKTLVDAMQNAGWDAGLLYADGSRPMWANVLRPVIGSESGMLRNLGTRLGDCFVHAGDVSTPGDDA